MSSIVIRTKFRTDYTVIQTWYKMAKLFGFTPINTESSLSYIFCKQTKTYPLILMLIHLVAASFSFYFRIYFYETFYTSEAILDFAQTLTEFLFLELVVLWSITRRNRWKMLMKNIIQLEGKMDRSFDESIKDSRISCIRCRIIVNHIVYFAVHSYAGFLTRDVIYLWLAFTIDRFTTYNMMFGTLFITFVCTWIKNRYLYLAHFLKGAIVSRNLKLAMLQKETIYEKLMECSQIYKDLYLIVQEVNAVFGYHFFFITVCTVLEILNSVNYAMPTPKQSTDNGGIIMSVVILISYCTCNVQIVMACDSVGKSAKNIWKTCLILHERTTDREVQQELLNLSNYIQGLSPEFSAAGFWTVDQSVLSALFSCVVTYLIVIIQFNMTLT